MDIYAIADLHLSGCVDKPMNVFGAGWEGHFEKIKADWRSRVAEEDVVLIAGDISWGMRLEEGLYDVASLKGLPGRKVFIRGNHDYWWNGITKIRDRAPDGTFYFLQNDCVRIGRCLFVGSRGWVCPGSSEYDAAKDGKIYLREAERFRLAFSAAEKVRQEGDVLIAMIHYPPFSGKREDTPLTRLFEEHGVSHVVFGHIHGSMYFPLETEKNGILYHLTSCDKLNFRLKRILGGLPG